MTRVTAKAKTANIQKIVANASNALMADTADTRERVANDIAGFVNRQYDILVRQWDGGEQFKQDEQRALRMAGYKKLAAYRAATRKTWPNLKFTTETQSAQAGTYRITVTTDNQLFRWLDRGTDDIVASKVTRIVPVEIVGTVPHAMNIFKSVSYNSPVVRYLPGQKIPGIEERDWSTIIRDAARAYAAEMHPQFKVTVDLYAR